MCSLGFSLLSHLILFNKSWIGIISTKTPFHQSFRLSLLHNFSASFPSLLQCHAPAQAPSQALHKQFPAAYLLQRCSLTQLTAFSMGNKQMDALFHTMSG